MIGRVWDSLVGAVDGAFAYLVRHCDVVIVLAGLIIFAVGLADTLGPR